MMREAPAILYCVGAAKAGTSWLHDWLAGHPQCHVRAIKELHYFDTIEAGEAAQRRDRLLAQAQGLEDQLAPAEIVRDHRELAALMAGGAVDEAGYLAYLTAGIAPGQRLVADITPAYALLPAARLAAMAALSPRTRFIYILRDPVDRLWSNIRMKAARRDGQAGSAAEWANRIFWRLDRGRNPGLAMRGEYGETLRKLMAAVPAAQLMVLFFEELFSQRSLDAIAAFLGLRPHPGRFDEAVNAGPGLPMRKDQKAQARLWLAAQYREVETLLGRIPPAWRANMTEVTV